MATLANIQAKIDELHGDMTYREVMSRGHDYLVRGRRKDHEFIVRTNMRTLRSGPNRGKVRVDGAIVIMHGNRYPEIVESALVRKGKNLLGVLDQLSHEFSLYGDR